MDEQISEVLKRLESMEQELSDIRGRLEAIELGATSGVSEKKSPKKRTILLICIPILIICLAVGGILAVRAVNATPKSGLNPMIAEADAFANAKIGDTIAFGKYDQNGSEADGPEPIEWIVLDKQDGKLLLLSRYILFNEDSKGKPWAGSKPRDTLNNIFLSKAYTSDEQNRICKTQTGISSSAIDAVFLLSLEEVERYLPDESSRICFLANSEVPKEWWLRTTETSNGIGSLLYRQYKVRTDGIIDYVSFNSKSSEVSFGIRPAMWVEIDP